MNLEEETFVCTKCGETFRTKFAVIDSRRKSKRRNTCKFCKCDKSREYYYKNREEILKFLRHKTNVLSTEKNLPEKLTNLT